MKINSTLEMYPMTKYQIRDVFRILAWEKYKIDNNLVIKDKLYNYQYQQFLKEWKSSNYYNLEVEILIDIMNSKGYNFRDLKRIRKQYYRELRILRNKQ